ncbi:MAG: hypothetical protein WC997_02275 [Porticoccaceae bacterium]
MNPVSNLTAAVAIKKPEREALAREVAEYKARGGVIQVLKESDSGIPRDDKKPYGRVMTRKEKAALAQED